MRGRSTVTILEALLEALLEILSGGELPRSELVRRVAGSNGASPGALAASLGDLLARGVLRRPSRGVRAIDAVLLGDPAGCAGLFRRDR